MKKFPASILFGAFLAGSLQAEPFQQAEVTRTVNLVSILKAEQKARPAGVGDIVNGRTAVKTGSDSRAELQFPDKTITRLGSNALFRFEAGGRSMSLDGGAMLFSSPKGVGGGTVQAGAVTAAVTGTDFLLAFLLNGEVKIIVLEGKVLVYLTRFPSIRRLLRTGQAVAVPRNATEIPEPYAIDLKHLIATSRLLESGGFGPLFTQTFIDRAANGQQFRIVQPQVPGSQNTAQQIAQITRRTANQPGGFIPKANPTPPPNPPHQIQQPPAAPPPPTPPPTPPPEPPAPPPPPPEPEPGPYR